MFENIKRGFTLAEVLITLGIIGVVAALTIPTLMNNYQKSQYVTGLKKAYTEINQALVQVAADRGCIGDLKCTGLFTFDSSDFGSEFVKYFNAIKNCEKNSGCFSNEVIVKDHYDGTGNLTGYDDWTSGMYRFITADGMVFSIDQAGDCSTDLSSNVTNNLTQYCADIYIDVNGIQGPNYLGRDIFMYYITNGKGPLLYPYEGVDDGSNGYWKDNNYCDPSHNDDWGCVARIMDEGWQMNY